MRVHDGIQNCKEIRNWNQNLPNVNAVGGNRAAIDLPLIAWPSLARKKMYRGMIAAKCTKGATIAASFAFEKKTDKKNPAMDIFIELITN